MEVKVTFCQDLSQCSSFGPRVTQTVQIQVRVSLQAGLELVLLGLAPLKPLLNTVELPRRRTLSTNLNRLSRDFSNQKHASDSGELNCFMACKSGIGRWIMVSKGTRSCYWLCSSSCRSECKRASLVILCKCLQVRPSPPASTVQTIGNNAQMTPRLSKLSWCSGWSLRLGTWDIFSL